MSSTCLHFIMNGSVPDEFLRKAERELNESPKKMKEGLQEIRRKLEVEKELRGVVFSDDFLLQFLRWAKYDLDRSFRQLQNFLHFRRHYKELFGSIDFEPFQRSSFFTILPRRCFDGCTVVLFELSKWDPSNVSFEDGKRLLTSLGMHSARHPMTQINGCKVIHDLTSAPLAYLRYATPSNLLQFAMSLKSLPVHYKEIHVVSNSILMKTIWMALKTMLSDKMLNRIKFHNNKSRLLLHFPPWLLPVHYGGTLDPHCTKETEEWMREANALQTDEWGRILTHTSS